MLLCFVLMHITLLPLTLIFQIPLMVVSFNKGDRALKGQKYDTIIAVDNGQVNG